MEDKTVLGFWIVIAGLLAVLAVFGLGVWKYSSAADAATAMSAVTGAIGAIVGAFFGVQVGSAGKDKSDNARDQAEKKLVRSLAALQLVNAADKDLVFKELAEVMPVKP